MNQPAGQGQEDWHQAKVFSVVHMLMTVVAISGGIWFVSEMRSEQRQTQARLETHIQLVEQRFAIQEERINRQVGMNNQEIARLYQAIDRMDQKLDRLIESSR